MPPKKAGAKKNKGNDWDDEAAERKIAALKLSQKAEDDDEIRWETENDVELKPTIEKKKGFSMAMLMDDDDDSDTSKSDINSEDAVQVIEKSTKVQKKQTEESKKKEDSKRDKKNGKKGKKGKQNNNDNDDLDAIIAELDQPIEKPEVKERKKNRTDEAKEFTPVEAKNIGSAITVDSVRVESTMVDVPRDTPEELNQEEENMNEECDTEEGDDSAKDKKKKKKDKKKDKKKEEKEGGGKGKKNKRVDMIKELLRAKKEAEEAEQRRVKEEEERLEAIAKVKEEEERLAREKREAKKAKEKAAIEKKKAEGTYLTAAQREKQRLAAAKLAAAGFTMPVPSQISDEGGEKKKSYVYMDKRALKKQQLKEQRLREQAEATKDESTSSSPIIPATPEPSKETTPEESNPVTPSETEPLDDWEMADGVEPTALLQKVDETKKEFAKAKSMLIEKKNIEDATESFDDSSSDDRNSLDGNSSEDESSDEDETPKGRETKEQLIERIKQRLKKRREYAESKRSTDNLRAPVICVLGHVDTGKTKMLDTIRRTNVQDLEAGGITQQIGATQVPADGIKERCKQVRDFSPDTMKIPGFLIIDTPGHESFSNLRSRGSSLCDFAILVVDIMHGLEPQTIESLKLLLKRRTPFVIALNKIDRLYGYETNPRKDVYQHLRSQPQNTQLEFKERYEKIVGEFAEQGINVILSNQNKNIDEYISMVPTSAFLGDGIGNLMAYIVNITQTHYANQLSFSEELDATVMEVKAIGGLGTTIDVILVNGRLRVGDNLVLTGTDGAIVTPIRELLMPQPLRELRVKNEYDHFKEVQGAQGVKVLAKGLEKTLAGLPIYVAHKEDEIDVLKEEAEAQLSRALTSIQKKPEGVYVQASTLGSLEALLEFLKTQKIPYSNVNIGPVHKKDVQKAAAMLEHKAEYACILAFDVKVEREAQIFADHEGVKIFQADIIYHLEDNFLKYREELRMKARRDNEHLAIFPCKLRVLPQHLFNARNPIVCGVVVEAGQLKRGTPICVPSKDGIFLGAVSSIERNHEEVMLAKTGDEVCIKIENTTGEAPKLYGRHFTHEDPLISRISRDSIDVCKTHFRDDLSKADWQLIVQLKRLLDIM